MHYFPDPDTPDLQPFTQAFVHLMFAHAGFERRVSDLMGVITCKPKFGEQPENRWPARKRPKLMKRLIKQHQGKRVGGVPELNEISQYGCAHSAPARWHWRVPAACGRRHRDRRRGEGLRISPPPASRS